MNKTVRRLLMLALLLVFVVSVGMSVSRTLQYKRGDEDHAEAEELVQLPDLSQLPPPTINTQPSDAAEDDTVAEDGDTQQAVEEVYVDPYADALRNMDFTALQEVNDEVLGWILIPGTPISYPLVQGEDNDYYLNRTWKKWRSVVGSIFLEYQNNNDFSDFNTIIYGHRMNNGTMFAALKNYKNQSYWEEHPCVYITDENGARKYDIFAAYEIGTQEDTYIIGFRNDAEKQAYIDFCLNQSVIDTGVVPTVYDNIITLSTCTGNGHATRWVVQARLEGIVPTEEEAEKPDASVEEDSSQEAPQDETNGIEVPTDTVVTPDETDGSVADNPEASSGESAESE